MCREQSGHDQIGQGQSECVARPLPAITAGQQHVPHSGTRSRRRTLLSKYGWDEREQVGARELRVRYIEPTDRPSTCPRSSASSTEKP
jgi:hypothetical protein